jgi:fatty acid desaturase
MGSVPLMNTRINIFLLAGFLLLQILQLEVIPLVLLPRSPAWGGLLLLPVLLTNSWWAFMHEAIHNHLFGSRMLSRTLGRINAVMFGAPFDLLRIGHILHHATSRTPRERSEIYVPGLHDPTVFSISYYFRLLGGLYFFEVLGGLVLLLPRSLIREFIRHAANPYNVVEELAHLLLARKTHTAARIEAIAIVALFTLAFSWYGPYWWMLLLALAGRGALISLMDNVFHYATSLGDQRSGHNLALPAWAGRLILNFNLHGIHHKSPAAPWHKLPELHRNRGGMFDKDFASAMLAQFEGPLPEDIMSASVP